MSKGAPLASRSQLLQASALAMLAITSASMGCSAVVANPPGEIRCEIQDGADDPCPEGLQCVEGTCQTERVCDALPNELCNGVDDDCDMRVDEGLEVDGDGDGYKACNAREPHLTDCDDNNSGIFPHEPGRDSRGDAPANYEPCNGRDDDCNPLTTETDGCNAGEVCYRPADRPALACYPIADCRTTGGSICGDGTFCGSEGRCLPNRVDMECTPLTRDARCDPGQYCDDEGQCVDTLTVGAACTTSVECATELCFSNEHFGLPGAGGFCGQSCCTTGDCGSGFACFVPGTGARSCYPAGLVTGEPACSHDEDCGSSRCRALSSAAGARSQCTSPGLRLGPGAPCAENSWCASGICFDLECNEVCQTNADCDGGACTYSPLSPTVPHCVPRDLGSGTSTEGCEEGCRDGRCWNDRCADACCTDEQCPAGFRCAVIDYGGPEMRCIPLSVAPNPN